MTSTATSAGADEGARVPVFGRRFFASDEVASRIGGGALGGKAEGLLRIKDALASRFGERPFRGVDVTIPRMVVLATDAFDAFMQRGRLYEVALSDAPDDRIAHAFQKADLPTETVGDLRALVEEAHTPLAVRSSSLLEDALAHPFAGVYETKMVPNLELDAATRFQGLIEAIKLVYASAFFAAARNYRRAIGADDRAEKMAVIIQEIVGARYGDRFYPTLSAVCRSFSYYPVGAGRPEDGVAQLALGLGKTIVDGGVCWSYSPRFPAIPPPFASPRSMLKETQARFWAVNMGRPPAYDPIAEAEYLLEGDLATAEHDGTLRYLASTYDAASDRLSPGTGRTGPRVLDFAPLLRVREWPLNDVLLDLVSLAEASLEQPVEIELAATLPTSSDGTARVGLVQVRAMSTPDAEVVVTEEDLTGPTLLLASRRVMGNGDVESVRDVVYLRPDTFDPSHSREMAVEVAATNRRLMDEERPYLLSGIRTLGELRSLAGRPGDLGAGGGGQGHRRGLPPERPHRPEPGVALLPQRVEPRRDVLLPRSGRADRRALDLAGGTAGGLGDRLRPPRAPGGASPGPRGWP